MPTAPKGAKWTTAPRVVDTSCTTGRIGVGFIEPGFTHLFVVPADGGTPRPADHRATGASAHASTAWRGAVGIDWTPDGRTIVVDGLDVPDADMRYRDSDLYAIDVAPGAIGAS